MLLKLEISRDRKFEGRRFVQIEQRRSVLLKLEISRDQKLEARRFVEIEKRLYNFTSQDLQIFRI